MSSAAQVTTLGEGTTVPAAQHAGSSDGVVVTSQVKDSKANNEEEDGDEQNAGNDGRDLDYQEWSGIDTMESMCMRCGENGVTRIMLHKIPYFRELVIASFQCNECGDRNNEVTFGGEIQIQGCVYELEVQTQRDLDRQLIKSDSATVRVKELEFEIPPMTQKGEISTIEGFLRTAAKNLALYQAERMEQSPEVGTKVAEIITQLTQMAFGNAFPFHISVDDPAGNSFVENPAAPSTDPNMTIRRYFRTAAQDQALGLQPDKGMYKDDKESNFKELVYGEGFGAIKKEKNQEQRSGDEEKLAPADAVRAIASSSSSSSVVAEGGEASAAAAAPLFNGHGEVISIPGCCPNCGKMGESLTAITTIPHFKEVIIMAFDCQICGYRTNEVKPGGAVPAVGTQVTLTLRSSEDLKRDLLKSDSAGILIPELDLELSNGSLGGIFTTVEGLLNKIHSTLKDSNPFGTGDSGQLHHSEDAKISESHLRFKTFLEKLKTFSSGAVECFPFTLVLRDPLGNSFISAPLGSFLPPEADEGLAVIDFTRTYDENEEFGLNDINTKDFETGVDHGQVIVSDMRSVGPHKAGADHPTPFAKGTNENDSTMSGFYSSSTVYSNANSKSADDDGNGDTDAPFYYKMEGYSAERRDDNSTAAAAAAAAAPPAAAQRADPEAEGDAYESSHHHRLLDPADKDLEYIPYEEFSGKKEGFVFRMGFQGIGYYKDIFKGAPPST